MTSGGELVGHAERALAAARRGEIDAVAVGGGDGSINAVASVLAGTEVPLGILPLGTLNHFAKDLGLPLDLDGAVAVIAAGETRRVDAADVNGHVFVNNSSIGLYPRMVLDRARQTAAVGRSKWLAMLLAFLRALRRFPRRRLWIRAAGVSERCVTPCLFIGNNEYGIDGLALGTRKTLDAGELCLYVARSSRPLDFVMLALRSLLGRLREAHDFDMFRISAVEVRSKASRLAVALDGEVTMLRPPLRYRVRKGALRVFAPAPEPAAAS